MLESVCPSLLGGLDFASSEALASNMRFERYRHKAIIFGAGDAAANVYAIVTGHVRLTRMATSGREVAIELLGPGEVLGEAALFNGRERHFTASAIGDVTAWSLGVADVLRVAQRNTRLAMNVAGIIHDRLLRISIALEDVACAPVPERLLRLFDRMDGRFTGIELTHADIALLVGSTRETVSAALGSLTRSGALRIDNKKIVIADRGRGPRLKNDGTTTRRLDRQKAYIP